MKKTTIQLDEINHVWFSKLRLDLKLKSMNDLMTRIRKLMNELKLKEEMRK